MYVGSFQKKEAVEGSVVAMTPPAEKQPLTKKKSAPPDVKTTKKNDQQNKLSSDTFEQTNHNELDSPSLPETRYTPKLCYKMVCVFGLNG